ncbi:hypothetical protein QZH41_015484 [Actinostola sp. cb2023]|nr:hypothetical protein QZH41_015484 [Actinostola sp. cb2023]
MHYGRCEWSQRKVTTIWTLGIFPNFVFAIWSQHIFFCMIPPGRQLPSSFYEGFSDAKLPFLKYTGRITYCHHRDECNFICDSLMTSEKEEKVMGFDMEWRVMFVKGGGSRKTALLQLCPTEDTCYLFQLSRMTGFPGALKSLLEDEKILKTGVGIQRFVVKPFFLSDIEKLSREFDVNPILANEKLKSNENWRLTGLVMNLFRHQLNKDNNIRCSNWETTPLSHEQKMYAATDAYVSIKLVSF